MNTTHDLFESAMNSFRQGRSSDAENQCLAILRSMPAHDKAAHLLGVIHFLNGDPVGAATLIEQSLSIAVDETKETDLGLALKGQKRHAESEAAFRRALELNPQFSLAHFHLATLLDRRAIQVQAESGYRLAVEASPNSGHYRFALGKCLANIGKMHDALEQLLRAAELLPHSAEVQNSLGIVLVGVDEHDRAELALRRAVQLKPNFAVGWTNLGNVLLATKTGDISEAIQCYRVAIGIDPDYETAHTTLAFTLPFFTDNGYEALDAARRHAERFEDPLASWTTHYENDADDNRRLRVGYVSPDFRSHCQAKFMLPLLRNHDHDVVEIYCYSSVHQPDDMTREHARYADVWRDVHSLDDEQLARQIRADKIDVLVDLTMHMVNGRRLTFARRPAPVQIAWLAYPGTTGSRSMGYRLTDPWLDPLETRYLDDRYTEKSIRLRDTFWCYEPLPHEAVISVGSPSDKGYITFGCLNNPNKLTHRAFSLWAKVLKQVENSRLLLLLPQGDARARVVSAFAGFGIDVSRLSLVSFLPPERYMRTYQDIDIVLDTFPSNGHTTSLDALWMGVPVVTLPGSSPISRAGYSLLSNLQLQEFAAATEEDYVRIAVELASDAARLAELRGTLRQRMMQSPLMDGVRFARSVEGAYREAWREWCVAVRSDRSAG